MTISGVGFSSATKNFRSGSSGKALPPPRSNARAESPGPGNYGVWSVPAWILGRIDRSAFGPGETP